MTEVGLTHGRKERLDAVSSLLGRVFDKDPMLRYMLCNLSSEQYLAYLTPYWRRLCKAAVLNDGIITEADGWKAAAVLMPPGEFLDNPWTMLSAGILNILFRVGISGCMRMLVEYNGPASAAKRKGLQGQKKYYYLFAIGTEYEHQGKGLAKAIIKYYQAKAQADQLPLWLEASSSNSRDIYRAQGFEEVDSITIGKGKVASDGTKRRRGPGVTFWPMVWWPKPLNN